MSTLNPPEIISELLEFQAFTQQYRYTRSISCCILTLILLEILFTFDKEITYIWRGSWSLFKVFFVACRYLSMVPALIIIIPPAPSTAYCTFVYWYIGLIIIVLSLFPSSALLAIRLDRLYASKLLRMILIALVFVEVASQLGVAAVALPKVIPTYNSIARACTGNALTGSIWLSKTFTMVPYLVLVCVYISIATYAFIQQCREKASLSNMWAARRKFAPLYILFIRDGVVCYIINLFGIICGFIILTTVESTNVLTLASPVIIAGITSISCCRLALLLHGDPGHATGVYQLNTNEILIENVEMLNVEYSNISSTCTTWLEDRVHGAAASRIG